LGRLLFFFEPLAVGFGLFGDLLRRFLVYGRFRRLRRSLRVRLRLFVGRAIELAGVLFLTLRRVLLLLPLALGLCLLLGAGAVERRLLLGRQRALLSGHRRRLNGLRRGGRIHDRRVRRRQRAERRRGVGRIRRGLRLVRHRHRLGAILLRRLALEEQAEDRDVADARHLLHRLVHRVVDQTGDGERLPV